LSFVEANHPAANEQPSLALRTQAALTMISSIDLSMVRKKILELDGWSEKRADHSELRYRRFLCMHMLHAKLVLVPASDIDVFWHQHILFTRRYADDCKRVLGGFLHHSPSTGSSAEQEHLLGHYKDTASFYAELFGEDYSVVDPDGTASNWLRFFE
jgi:hypothetical protein